MTLRFRPAFSAVVALVLACVCFGSTSLSLGQKKEKEVLTDKDTSVITLNECWQYRSDDLLSLRPAVDRSNLYLAENGGRVSAVSLVSGIRLWSTDLGGDIRSNVAVQGPLVFVAMSDASKRMRLRGLSIASGIPTTDIDLPFATDARLASTDGKLVVAEQSGYLAMFSAGSQKPDWLTTIPGMDVSNLVFAQGRLIVPAQNVIKVISLADGSIVTSTLSENPVSTLGLYEDNMVAGDSRGNLIRFDSDYRTVYWRLRNGARMSSVVATDKGVLAASLDNFVYMVSGYYGDIRWKRRMSGRVSSIVANNDIAIVQTIGEPNAAILNLENGKPAGELTIGDDDSFTQPVVAADGRFLFFTTARVLAESTVPCSAK